MRAEQDEGKFPPMLREVDLGVRHRTDHPWGGMVPSTHQVPADLGQSSGGRTGCVKPRQPAYKTIQLPACSGFQAPSPGLGKPEELLMGRSTLDGGRA